MMYKIAWTKSLQMNQSCEPSISWPWLCARWPSFGCSHATFAPYPADTLSSICSSAQLLPSSHAISCPYSSQLRVVSSKRQQTMAYQAGATRKNHAFSFLSTLFVEFYFQTKHLHMTPIFLNCRGQQNAFFFLTDWTQIKCHMPQMWTQHE